MPIVEGIIENTTNIVSLERRLDRQAIGQLRAEIVRLDAELTRANEELAQAKSQLEWHQESADFWQDVAEMQRDGRQVGITKAGQAVPVHGSDGAVSVIEKASRLIEENAEALLETSCLDGVWDTDGDEAAYLDWVSTARELRGLAEMVQSTTSTSENFMYVYISTEPGVWTVGFYDPTGKFQPESDHPTPNQAASRVAWLNGETTA